MNQALKKIRTLFTLKDFTQQNKVYIQEQIIEQRVCLRTEIPPEEIQYRAYMIWRDRGCGHGNHFEDWVLARIQLEDERN